MAKDIHRILIINRDPISGPTRVPVLDPCPSGLSEILSVAHLGLRRVRCKLTSINHPTSMFSMFQLFGVCCITFLLYSWGSIPFNFKRATTWSPGGPKQQAILYHTIK